MAADVLRSKCARARGTLYLLSPECIALYDNLDAFFILAGISRPYRKLHWSNIQLISTPVTSMGSKNWSNLNNGKINLCELNRLLWTFFNKRAGS